MRHNNPPIDEGEFAERIEEDWHSPSYESKRQGVSLGPIESFVNEKGFYKFEVVYNTSSPIRAAHRSAGTMRFLVKQAGGDINLSDGYTVHPTKISFDAYNPENGNTFGKHLNISLHAIGNNNRYGIPYNLLNHHTWLSEQVSRQLYLAAASDTILLCPSRKSYNRIEFGEYSPDSVVNSVFDRGESDVDKRKEFRLPDIEADPFDIVLVSIAAAYRAVKEYKFAMEISSSKVVVQEPSFIRKIFSGVMFEARTRSLTLPDRLEESLQRFQKGSRLIDTLTQIAKESPKQEEILSDIKKYQGMVLEQYKQTHISR